MKKFLFTLFVIAISLLQGKAQTKTYVFATYTYATNNRLQNLTPLVTLLSEKTGLNIKAKSYPTVQALINAIKTDSVDFAMMNTSGYLVLERKHPNLVAPLVNLDLGNNPNVSYSGCLIANKQTGIVSTKNWKVNTKKYSLALVNSASTSGNLVPRLILNRKGIPNPEASFHVGYSGTHKKVVEEVLNGTADLGGCGCAEVDSARKYLSFDSKSIVIYSLGDIPLGPIVFNTKLNETVVKLISEHLLTVHRVDPAVFANFCDGWSEFKQAKQFKTVSDKHYDSFRKLFGNNTQLWKLIE
jgi:phosphonate transport system substrate-binding protein